MIVCMLATSGVTSPVISESAEGIGVKACLLHAGQQALSVKNFLAVQYRSALQSGNRLEWDEVCEPIVQKAMFLAEYSQPCGIVTPALELSDEVFAWHSANAKTDSRCMQMDKAGQFLQSSLTVTQVRNTLLAREQAATEAELGYKSAVNLLQAGSIHKSTGLERTAVRCFGRIR